MPNNRVTYQGNHGGILTTRNPLCWDRGSPLGMNSRPRDIEDSVVLDSLDDIIGLASLGMPVDDLGLDSPNPFAAITAPINNMFAAPKMIAIGAAVGGVAGIILGYMIFGRKE